MSPFAPAAPLGQFEDPNVLNAYKGWSFNPEEGGANTILVSGDVQAVKVATPSAIASCVSASVFVQTGGATLTAGQNLVGLYSVAGGVATLIATSVDQTAAWAGTGELPATWTAPVPVPGGPSSPFCYVCIMSVGTTPPTLFRGGASLAQANLGLTAAQGFKCGRVLAGQTALPASFLVNSITPASTFDFFAGLK